MAFKSEFVACGLNKEQQNIFQTGGKTNFQSPQ